VKALATRIVLMVAFYALAPTAALACATCFGAKDAPQTKGMNMAILGMLVVTVGIMGAMGAFFLYLKKRSGLPLNPPDSRGAAQPPWPVKKEEAHA